MTKKLNLEDFKDNKEDILNSMFQSIQDGICILDSDLTIRQVNKAMENLYGKKIDLIGKKCHQIFQNRESPCEICPANNSIESRKISSKVLPLVTDGVQTGWLEVFAYPLIDESTNTAYGVVEFIRNITEKKSMEEKLLQEKEKFKTTLLSVGEGIISTDFKGNITILNKVAEDLTGWYENEAFGKPIEKVFNIFDESKENYYYKTIKSSIIKGETFKSRDYMTLISKNGNKIPVEVTVSPIKESGKKISGAVIVFKDFTEKKKIHDEILYLSLHDHLTGLYNRKSFEEKLKELDIEKNLPLYYSFWRFKWIKTNQ